MTMINGVQLATGVKKNVFGLYLKALDALDPQVAGHIVKGQRELFLAGQRFFESEVGHASKAIDKYDRKAAEKKGTAPATPAPGGGAAKIEVVSE